MKTRSVVLLVVLALGLAACGGGGDADSGQDEPASDDTAENSTDEGASEGDTAPPAGEAESLSDFFGDGTDDPAAQQAEWRDQEARVQELIRQCMAEEGFEYQPVLPPEENFEVMQPEDQEEEVRTRGFGITTWYGNEEQMGMDSDFEDPNQEMLEEMSDSERQAWQEALYGTQEEQEELMETEVDEETGETIGTMTGFGPGCQGEAQEAEFGDMNETRELWQELQPAMQDLQERVEADPRIVEANESWSSCMAEAGFDGYESRDDMFNTVFTEFEERLNELTGGSLNQDPFEGWSQEEIDTFFEENTQDEIDAFFQEAREDAQAEVDMDAVEELQQEEIDMALANMECGEELDDLYVEVREEYEEDFIAENREVLEDIREAQNG